MFVQIIRKGHTSTYECEIASFHPNTKKGLEDTTILLVLEGMKITRMLTFELEKATNKVYFLNNEGKTIDTYWWKDT